MNNLQVVQIHQLEKPSMKFNIFFIVGEKKKKKKTYHCSVFALQNKKIKILKKYATLYKYPLLRD